MKRNMLLRYMLLLSVIVLILPYPSNGDENLALYGLKGYAYVFSPLTVQGLYLQTGGIYSNYSGNDSGDGYIWAVPVSVTYGDGKYWEIVAAIHGEYWKNTDANVNEKGTGDLFLGGKLSISQLIGSQMPLDLAIMPYVLIPTGNRDKSIGDLYSLNPSADDDVSAGVNLLLGKQLSNRFYIAADIGLHYVNTDDDSIDSTSTFLGLALEYHISESLTSYVEFFNAENKREVVCPACYTIENDEDVREIGVGILWLKGKWGFKLHAGVGLTDTSPDFIAAGLINRNF